MTAKLLAWCPGSPGIAVDALGFLRLPARRPPINSCAFIEWITPAIDNHRNFKMIRRLIPTGGKDHGNKGAKYHRHKEPPPAARHRSVSFRQVGKSQAPRSYRSDRSYPGNAAFNGSVSTQPSWAMRYCSSRRIGAPISGGSWPPSLTTAATLYSTPAGKPASSRPLRCKFSRLPDPPLCSGPSPARGDSGAHRGPYPRAIAGTDPGEPTNGDHHGYHTRHLHQVRQRRLHRHPQDPPRHCGGHHRPGRQDVRQRARSPGLCRAAPRDRRRLEPGREVERRDYLNLKIGAPEFGPTWVRCRLVKLEQPAEDGATHIALWEPRDR